MLGTIELTPQDRVDAVHIQESWRWLRGSDEHDPDRVLTSNAIAESLFRRLMGREAIPQARLNTFTKSEYNGSNPRSSHLEIFAANAGGSAEVFSRQAILEMAALLHLRT